MSTRPPLLPHDPFNRCTRLPTDLDRHQRVKLVRDAARVLMQRTDDPACLFVGGALSAWLERGGDLCGDYLRVTGRRGSHSTPSAIAHEIEQQEASSSR